MIILVGRKIWNHWMFFLITTYGFLQRDTCKIGQVVFCSVRKIFSNSLVKESTHSCPRELWICFLVLCLSTSSSVALCVLPQRPCLLLQRDLPFSLHECCPSWLSIWWSWHMQVPNSDPQDGNGEIHNDWPHKDVVKLDWLVALKSFQGKSTT